MTRKKKSATQDLMGIVSISAYSIQSTQDELVYYKITPTNISVLSESSITQHVNAMSNVLQGFATLEILCLDAKENFSGNKQYLNQRMREEENECIRTLLQADSENLDKLQTAMSTAREFFVAIRLNHADQKTNVRDYLTRVEKSIADQGFSVKLAQGEDLKRLLSVYFIQNNALNQYADFDGAQWLDVENMCK